MSLLPFLARLEPKWTQFDRKHIVGGCGVCICETVTLCWDMGYASCGNWETFSPARQIRPSYFSTVASDMESDIDGYKGSLLRSWMQD